jgi:lysophospholipase L1-like esterase
MSKLEKYEWDSLWWEEPENENKRHVLYIGDSISHGTTPKLNALDENLAVDNFATSKAVDNPSYIKALEVFAAQNPGYDTLLFNNGLHGFHLSAEAYEKHYDSFFSQVKELFKNAKPYIILSTFTKKDYNSQTILRNAAAVRIAEKHGIEIIDFYTLSKENAHTISSDNVHFTDEGYELLAKEIFKRI